MQVANTMPPLRIAVTGIAISVKVRQNFELFSYFCDKNASRSLSKDEKSCEYAACEKSEKKVKHKTAIMNRGEYFL